VRGSVTGLTPSIPGFTGSIAMVTVLDSYVADWTTKRSVTISIARLLSVP